MIYRLNPNLFVENGAAVQSARTREARLALHEHELARKETRPAESRPTACLAA
jgi:hypothetical protein